MSSASNSGETTTGPATFRASWLILASLVGASLLIVGTLSLAVYTGQASAEEKKNDCEGLSLPFETPGSAHEQRNLLMRQVTECMRQGKRAQAMALITEVIKSNPTDAEAYMNRGSAQTSLGEVELAISDFRTAIRLDPNLAPAWYNRGTTFAHVGRYESAIADFTEAMRLQLDFPLAYCNRGLAKTELGRYDEALADYTKGIEQDPNPTNCSAEALSISRWANARKRSTTSPDSSNSEPTV
jgi:tetratricopeptide (TPR) repeat protein